MTEVSCLYQHLCSPCEGNLNAVYKVVRYLHNNLSKNSVRMAFAPSCAHTDEKVFEEITRELKGWKEF